MKKVSQQQLRLARAAFYQSVFLCIGAIVLIHGFDFSGLFSHRFNDPFRKYCTLAYFAALLGLCVMFTKPYIRYLETLYAWRFEDCPAAIEMSWREYLHSLDRAILPFAIAVGAFIFMTGLKVLAEWYPSLAVLRALYGPGWWLALVSLFAIPFGFGDRVNEAMQRKRLLDEQLVTSRFKPRVVGTVEPSAEQLMATPVQLRGPLRFHAGGIEWDWEDFYKSCMVLGQPGSGKTLCVLNALLDGLVGSASGPGAPGCSALILDPKGDYRGKIETLCRNHGRQRDLLILKPDDPRASIRWNPLDSTDPDLEIAERFVGVMETLGVKSQDTSFWIDSARKFIRHSITLIRLTNPVGAPPSLLDVARLSSSFRMIADRTDRLDVRDARADRVLYFFAEEWTQYAPETRTSIQGHISNMLDPFLGEPYCSQFSGSSSIRVGQLLDRGKILYVDMPIAVQPSLSRTIGTFLKLEFFNEVLRRLDNPTPSLFMCDEFQAFFTHRGGKGDADFFDKSRQSNHANLIATQNINGLLRQCERREHAETLLGLCQTKIFLRNTDHATNEYAARLFGESIEKIAGSTGGGGSWGVGGARPATLSSASQGQWGYNVRPERFTELAIPSRNDGTTYAESIVHQAARAAMAEAPTKSIWPVHPIVS